MYPSPAVYAAYPPFLNFTSGFLSLTEASIALDGIANYTTVFRSYQVNPQVCGESAKKFFFFLEAHLFLPSHIGLHFPSRVAVSTGAKKCATACATAACWNQDGNDCQRCPLGQYLRNGTCVSDCNLGDPNPGWFAANLNPYVPAYQSDKYGCVRCHESCYRCSGLAANQCTKCDGSHVVMTDGTCLTACPSGYFNQGGNCTKCSSTCMECNVTSTRCTKCRPTDIEGYLGPNNTCVENCPAGYYKNPSTGVCTVCNAVCAECSDSATTCTRCPAGSFLQGTSCVPSCTSGQYGDNSTWTCQPCNEAVCVCVCVRVCVCVCRAYACLCVCMLHVHVRICVYEFAVCVRMLCVCLFVI